MTYRSMTFFLTALTTLAAGCDLGGAACTDIAVASVSLQVVDGETGATIDMPAITFTVDDEPDERQPAEDFDGNYVLTYEEVGTFEVSISADGYEGSTQTYEVVLDEDGCHPVGTSDVIELEPTP